MKPLNLNNKVKQFNKLNLNYYAIFLLINLHKRCNLVTAYKNQELNNYDQLKPSDESRASECEIANYATNWYTSIKCNSNEFLTGYFKQTCPEIQQKTKNEFKKIQTKYLLYDVNPAEGFNLRRDVYIRIAKLVKILNKYCRIFKYYLIAI